MRWNDVFATDGLYTYESNPYDDSLFWPAFLTPTPEAGKMPFDRPAFFSYLKRQVGHMEALTEDPFEAIEEVGAWSQSRLYHWQRIYDVLASDYEPLWNYNRYDEESENAGTNTTEDTTENENATSGTQDSATGYDGGAPVDTAQEEAQSTRDDLINRIAEEKRRRERINHSYGNIGVMSTQDLVKQEIEIAQISLYNLIIDEFKAEFCVLIY